MSSDGRRTIPAARSADGYGINGGGHGATHVRWAFETPGAQSQPEARQAMAFATAVSVTFEVTVQTHWGDTALIVGNTSELGGWNVSAGLALSTDEHRYPNWRSTLPLCGGTDIEFKVVLCRADGTVEWEPIRSNRHLRLLEAQNRASCCVVTCKWAESQTTTRFVPSRPPVHPGPYPVAVPAHQEMAPSSGTGPGDNRTSAMMSAAAVAALPPGHATSAVSGLPYWCESPGSASPASSTMSPYTQGVPSGYCLPPPAMQLPEQFGPNDHPASHLQGAASARVVLHARHGTCIVPPLPPPPPQPQLTPPQPQPHLLPQQPPPSQPPPQPSCLDYETVSPPPPNTYDGDDDDFESSKGLRHAYYASVDKRDALWPIMSVGDESWPPSTTASCRSLPHGDGSPSADVWGEEAG